MAKERLQKVMAEAGWAYAATAKKSSSLAG